MKKEIERIIIEHFGEHFTNDEYGTFDHPIADELLALIEEDKRKWQSQVDKSIIDLSGIMSRNIVNDQMRSMATQLLTEKAIEARSDHRWKLKIQQILDWVSDNKMLNEVPTLMQPLEVVVVSDLSTKIKEVI